MADTILTETSLLVYDFAYLRSKIPFENNGRAHKFFYAFALLLAYSGNPPQKDRLEELNDSVNKNQSMRRHRIGLEFFQILLWVLMFGDCYVDFRQRAAIMNRKNTRLRILLYHVI